MTENNSEIFISHSVAEKLLHAHDGDCTLLFLWQKMTGNTDPETAAGDLCMTRSQTDYAVEKLSRMGLWGAEATVPKPAPVRKPVMPADEPPAYTSEEIVRTVREDKIFCTLRDKMQEVIGKGIILEMCPTSNRQTCAVADFSKYPLIEYLHLGLKVTINTDDPAIECTTIDREFALVREAFGLTEEEEEKLLLNAVDAAFMSDEAKKELSKQIKETKK